MIAEIIFALALQSADPIGDLLQADATMPSAGERAIPATPEPAVLPVRCEGEFTQGAMLICRMAPGTEVDFGDQSATADSDQGSSKTFARRCVLRTTEDVRGDNLKQSSCARGLEKPAAFRR